MATLFIILAMIFVLGPIAKAYAERLSKDAPPELEANRVEMARLKDEVDRLSVEVGRLQDEQSFMLRLLNEGDRKKLLQEGDHT